MLAREAKLLCCKASQVILSGSFVQITFLYHIRSFLWGIQWKFIQFTLLNYIDAYESKYFDALENSKAVRINIARIMTLGESFILGSICCLSVFSFTFPLESQSLQTYSALQCVNLTVCSTLRFWLCVATFQTAEFSIRQERDTLKSWTLFV